MLKDDYMHARNGAELLVLDFFLDPELSWPHHIREAAHACTESLKEPNDKPNDADKAAAPKKKATQALPQGIPKKEKLRDRLKALVNACDGKGRLSVIDKMSRKSVEKKSAAKKPAARAIRRTEYADMLGGTAHIPKTRDVAREAVDAVIDLARDEDDDYYYTTTTTTATTTTTPTTTTILCSLCRNHFCN